MPFTKVKGHNVLISATAVSPEQFKLVQEIIKLNGGARIRRKDLKAAHATLRGRKASPYFIAKNVAIQVKGENGVYDLGRIKLRVEKKKAVKPTAEEGAPKVKPAKAKRAAKKVAAPVESTELVLA